MSFSGNPFVRELTSLINRYGMDDTTGVPDYLLAEHLWQEAINLGVSLDKIRRWHDWPSLAEKHKAKFAGTGTITHDTEGGPDVG